jgi:hypothetical protein
MLEAKVLAKLGRIRAATLRSSFGNGIDLAVGLRTPHRSD